MKLWVTILCKPLDYILERNKALKHTHIHTCVLVDAYIHILHRDRERLVDRHIDR